MSDPDPRIAQGTTRMLTALGEATDRGAVRLGWKAGFGAPAALASLGTDRPLVGFLTEDRLLADGDSVDVSGWTKPVLEAEVAAHIAADLGRGATRAEALAAVGGWSVAIELADVDRVPDDVEEIQAGNIFHRHVLLGPVVATLPKPLAFLVSRDGVETARTDQPDELTGELGFVLASMADTLATVDGGLCEGDVVITGSVVAPIPLTSGSWVVDADGLGRISVSIG
jgi:2-keto-4-pentenoate hydratase